jgi:hypothetical protein
MRMSTHILIKFSRHFSFALVLASSSLLSGCAQFFDKQVVYETVTPDTFPQLSAGGYAPISSQPGESGEEKMLMAMKASKLEAYRELTEQVYGQTIDGKQTVAAMIMRSSALNASVNGVIRGAEVVKSYSVGEDTYATEMRLDMKVVHDLYLSSARPQRVKNVIYY